MATETLEPKDMAWLDKGVLGIEWSDGHKAVYPVRYLRLHCPCAACTDEWTGELKLKPDEFPMLIRLDDAEPVNPTAFEATTMPPCGTTLASFDGTNAYSNGPYTGTGTSCAGSVTSVTVMASRTRSNGMPARVRNSIGL